MASSIVNPVLANYNTTPSTQTGSGAYGAVPGAVATPPSTYEQVSGILPQLSSLTSQNADLIGQQMKGILPTDVIQQIQNQAASWGVSSGMPGSGLSQNLSLRDLGLTSLSQQQAGQDNYLKTLSGLGQQQLDPGLLTSLGQYNSTMAAAPNPAAAAEQQAQDYQDSMKWGADFAMQNYLSYLDPSVIGKQADASNYYGMLTKTTKPQSQKDRAVAQGGGNAWQSSNGTWFAGSKGPLAVN
jgi:hypothetical protein